MNSIKNLISYNFKDSIILKNVLKDILLLAGWLGPHPVTDSQIAGPNTSHIIARTCMAVDSGHFSDVCDLSRFTAKSGELKCNHQGECV
jgi:hypothetical protein